MGKPNSRRYEPPREKWRLQAVRGWSNDKTGEVSSGDSGTGGAPCAGAPGRVPVTVGGDQLDRHEVRNDTRDAAQMGAAGGGGWRRPARPGGRAAPGGRR